MNHCSECGGALPTSKGRRPRITCSDTCRTKRSRRLAGQRESRDIGEQILADGGFQADAAVQAEIKEIVAPVVRQALTEDVLKSLARLVELTPAAVAAIEDDLASEDPILRQRAYTLLMKYTVGHQAIVTAEDSSPKSQMVVQFNLPRPETTVLVDDYVPEEIEPWRECDICKVSKPKHEMADGSDRCKVCFEKRRQEILAAYS